MPAETLNCPMCGASAATDASKCEHCGARLATVACPSCFGLNFQGAKFCSHCGARVDRTEVDDAAPRPCPRCQVNMGAVSIGRARLRECPRCDGLWADPVSIQDICADREQQAAVLGMPGTLPANPTGSLEANIRYMPCPVCGKLMNRINFANCSHVIVDVCRQHGTWFDKDELRRIVEFIRSGGMEKSRKQEIDELERRRRALTAAQQATPGGVTLPSGDSDFDERHLGISIAAAVLKSIFK